MLISKDIEIMSWHSLGLKLFVNFSGEWRVFKGPNMPVALLGACAAPLNSRQIILMGGYSALTNDYTDNAYIFTTSNYEWEKKNWARLKNGPRLGTISSTPFRICIRLTL